MRITIGNRIISFPKEYGSYFEIVDQRVPGESFCSDCPDHEACMSGYPCSLVKRVDDEFDKLNEMIPYVVGGKSKILSMHPYNAITLRMPGRHAKDTDPIGGDFVVCVDDENMDWIEHQFTHIDLFRDLEQRTIAANSIDSDEADFLIRRYADIVANGDDPEKMSPGEDYVAIDGCIHPKTFLYSVQCLAVAEHRRYAQFESKFGGRFLPFRFGAGIVEGLWTATDAAEKQKRGRPGVEWLEKDHGVPYLTKELMA